MASSASIGEDSEVIQVSDTDSGSSDGTYVIDSDLSEELIEDDEEDSQATERAPSPVPPLPSLNVEPNIDDAIGNSAATREIENNPGSPVPSTSAGARGTETSNSPSLLGINQVNQPQNEAVETSSNNLRDDSLGQEGLSEVRDAATPTNIAASTATARTGENNRNIPQVVAATLTIPPIADSIPGPAVQTLASILPQASSSFVQPTNSPSGPQAAASASPRRPSASTRAGRPLDTSIDDFAPSPPRKRIKHSSSTSTSSAKAAEPSSTDDDDGQCCPICFDEWTNSGSHRLCCLKCGHIFGHSCIDRWLRDKKQKGLCPQCNKPAKLKDIRFIFAKNLKVTDTSERDSALKALDEKKEHIRRAEMEVAKMRMVCQRANEDCNILRQENVQLKQQLQQLRSQRGVGSLTNGAADINASQSTAPASVGSYAFDRAIKVNDGGNCRVMAYSPECATLVVSQPSTSHLFPGFGVKKISAMDFKTYQFVSIHSKMIRDLCFNREGCMLSAAMDKNVKITSINSNTVVQMYSCPMPVWSCCWSEDDRFCFFAGLANGKVRCYDIRNTLDYVSELNTQGSGSPVVSLQYVKMNPNANFRPGGVIVSQLACSTFFEKKDEEFRPHVLPLEGNLMYMSLEDRSRHILATYRPNNRCPTVKHDMFELSCSNVSTDPTVITNSCTSHSIQSFTAGRECKALSRTRLLRHPATEDKLLACAGDEASKSLFIWDTQSGKLSQRIPCLADVVDICSVPINDDNYLAALTDKTVRLHKWTA